MAGLWILIRNAKLKKKKLKKDMVPKKEKRPNQKKARKNS